MATSNVITGLITALTELDKTVCLSESEKRRAGLAAIESVQASTLNAEDKNSVITAIAQASNPTGYYYNTTGITAGLEALEDLEEAATVEAPTRPVAGFGFNRANLKNLIADGSIFSVEFIKRTDGSLRKMVCRTGVVRHLRGGRKPYSAKQRDLLTVFDMKNKGYRSIPVEAIQRLSVNGQTFVFAGAQGGVS